jgi:hypothetical protein
VVLDIRREMLYNQKYQWVDGLAVDRLTVRPFTRDGCGERPTSEVYPIVVIVVLGSSKHGSRVRSP